MKEFMLIFRSSGTNGPEQSPAQTQATEKEWADWIGSIAAQGKFVNGVRPGLEGRSIKSGDLVTDGPYAEVKEIIVGVIVVKAEKIEGAISFAKGCPILKVGGNVEVRDVMPNNI